MYAKTKAEELWEQYHLSIPVDLKRVVRELGLKVIPFSFHGRIKEMFVDRTIGVQPGLRRPWFRWYVAHAIGHHVLHVGTSFYQDWWQWVNHTKAERQAEEFAAWLMGGANGSQHTASELRIPREKFLLVRALAGLQDGAESPGPIGRAALGVCLSIL